MKMTLASLLTFVFLMSGFSQLQAQEENRDLPAFSEIALNAQVMVYVKQGDTQEVKLVGKRADCDEIITEVGKRRLTIRNKTSNLFKKSGETPFIKIYITTPEIGDLRVSGTGVIMNDGPIKSRILSLTLSGSGRIKLLDLEAERLTANMSGSGNVELDGPAEAREVSVNISGSGSFLAEDFEADDVTVRIAGSGSAKVHCNNKLNAGILGSGNILYNGNPSIEQSVGGSGRVDAL